MTIGGIYGNIVEVKEDGTLIMEVEDGTKMKIAKTAVSSEGSVGLQNT